MSGGNCLLGATYTFTDLVVPGATYTTPQDISNTGLITGTYGLGLFPTSGFVWRPDSGFTLFDAPNINPTFGTEAYGVNDAGVIIGSVFPGCCSSVRSGFVREPDGTITLLPYMSLIRGINNAGDITGLAGSAAIRAAGGGLTFFNISGVGFLIPEDINNFGTVVGYTDTSGFIRFSNGSIVMLQVPDAAFTVATGVNDRHEVVGFYRDAQIRQHGFLWDATNGFRTFNNPAAGGDTLLYGINNSGTVVGAYQGAPGLQRGFFATADQPIPEPGTFSVVAIGLVGLLASRRRFKSSDPARVSSATPNLPTQA